MLGQGHLAYRVRLKIGGEDGVSLCCCVNRTLAAAVDEKLTYENIVLNTLQRVDSRVQNHVGRAIRMSLWLGAGADILWGFGMRMSYDDPLDFMKYYVREKLWTAVTLLQDRPEQTVDVRNAAFTAVRSHLLFSAEALVRRLWCSGGDVDSVLRRRIGLRQRMPVACPLLSDWTRGG